MTESATGNQPGLLTTITLFMANFAIWPTQLVITLFLIDIAEAFNSSPGVVGLVLGAFTFIPIFIYRYLIEDPESQTADSPTQAS